MHHPQPRCTVTEIAALGGEINANQYRLVRLAARYDRELDWHREGYATASLAIAETLDLHTSTAREWIRVGHALGGLPLINEAFAGNTLSYAKVRILTRWADPDNEPELLELAREHSANRLTTHIAKHLAATETEETRDQRLHDQRSMTHYTNADGMIVIRLVLPPTIGKTVIHTVETVMHNVAATPMDGPDESPPPNVPAPVPETVDVGGASADAPRSRTVKSKTTQRQPNASADASHPTSHGSMRHQLQELKRRWHTGTDEPFIPTLAQQRADAFTLLFLCEDISVTTEVILHVRGDGATFDDGTPITESAVIQQLDDAFIRFMLHDPNRRPIDATNRRRHPTTRQKRVVMEAHNHECVDCGTTELLELDHDPPYHQTHHTVTSELKPRCAPCHRAHHRHDGFTRGALGPNPLLLPDRSSPTVVYPAELLSDVGQRSPMF